MREVERLKEEILRDYPKLTKDSSFSFACHPGVPCFNACCADVNIFLTPYDILRLKNNLGMTSEQFLSKYTVSPFDKNSRYPVILLAMNEDEKKSCPFVGEGGCTVYEDRPWACRMYPLGMGSHKDEGDGTDSDFYFLLKEDLCKGHNEDKEQTIAEWLDNQGINEYDQMGYYFKELTLHEFFQKPENLTPKKIEMFFTACYNLDEFRRFIFESSFFDKFEADEAMKEKLKTDDVELLKFSYFWLRFALFGEKTMKVKEEVLEAKQKELDKKKKAGA
jgi:Fe-S-cluster containining protein